MRSCVQFPVFGFVGMFVRGLSDGGYVDAADATASHLGYGVASATVFDAFADGREMAEMREEEACEGFDARLAGEGPMELSAEVAEGCAAVDRGYTGGA